MEQIDRGMSDETASQRPAASSSIARLAVLAIVLAIILLGWRYLGPRGALAKAGWMHDWDAAVVQSRSSGKPALVLFTADWCPACRQFESLVLCDSDVQEYLKKNYTLLVVDLSNRADRTNGERARDCGVRSIPTLILYDAAGQERARGHGMPSDVLLRWLQTNQ